MMGKKNFFKKNEYFYGTLLCTFLVSYFVPFAFLFKYPDPYTTIKWFITLVSLNVIIFLFLTNSKTIIFPKFPKIFFYILGLIFWIIIINSYYHNVPLLTYENIRRFIFWGGCIFFFNLFFSEKEQAFYKIENVICFTAALFVPLVLIQYLSDPQNPPYLSFGNINLSAEFVCFSFAFQLGSLVRLWEKGKNSIFLYVFTALSLSYLYFTNCRSVYIAVFFIVISTFFFKKNIWKPFLKLLILSVLFIITLRGVLFILYPHISIHVEKEISIRWSLYLNTLKMVIEIPLGVGVGQYEFASIPYVGNIVPQTKETTLFLSPHNEFLHFLAEDGVILSLLFFVLGSAFIFSYWKEIKKIFFLYPEFFYFTVVFFIQSLFQFPLIEPVPYFMTIIMLGFFFSLIKIDHLTYTLSGGLKFILSSANLLMFFLFIIHFSSKYIVFNFPKNENLNRLACSFGVREWHSCLNVGSSRIDQGDYVVADTYASRVLEWQPLNYQAIRMLGFSSLYQGNHKKACELFKQYDELFENESSLHGEVLRECQPSKLY